MKITNSMLELVLAEALLSLVGEDVMIWLQSITLREEEWISTTVEAESLC